MERDREGHTGSDRRLRHTVPRKQHRREQLQSLQRHTGSFEKEERTRACGGWWRRNARCALSRGKGPVEYAVSASEWPFVAS